jgi:hypothetical protein
MSSPRDILPGHTGYALLGGVMWLAARQGQYELVSQSEQMTLCNRLPAVLHVILLHFISDCGAAERFCSELPDHEFTVPGVIVAQAQARELSQVIGPDYKVLVMAELLLVAE